MSTWTDAIFKWAYETVSPALERAAERYDALSTAQLLNAKVDK